MGGLSRTPYKTFVPPTDEPFPTADEFMTMLGIAPEDQEALRRRGRHIAAARRDLWAGQKRLLEYEWLAYDRYMVFRPSWKPG